MKLYRVTCSKNCPITKPFADVWDVEEEIFEGGHARDCWYGILTYTKVEPEVEPK